MLGLLLVAALDEATAGAPMLATPELASSLGGGLSAAAAAIFAVPVVIGAAVEPFGLAWSDRVGRRNLLFGALMAMGVGHLLLGVGYSWTAVAVGVSVWGIGSGLSTGLAEVELVARARSVPATLSRWAAFGAAGDLMGPLAFAALGMAGLGWRTLCGIGALTAVGLAVATLWSLEGEASGGDEEESDSRPGWWRSAPLWWAALAATACTLFDEIWVATTSTWLWRAGLGEGALGLSAGAFAVGALAGLAVVERLRWRPETTLLVSAGALIPAWCLWLALPPVAAVPVSLLIGAFAAPLWPLTTALAYACVPDRPGTVAACLRVVGTLDIILPLVVGAVADGWGLTGALLLLLLQPLCVAVFAAQRRCQASP